MITGRLLATLVLAIVICAEIPTEAAGSFALKDVTIIDTRDGSKRSGMTLVVRGERIVRIGQELELPDGIETVDADGKLLIPGLWDMHVHWYFEPYLPLFVVNGVTGVRQMFGSPLHAEWKRKIAKGELVGPRQVVASRIVDGPNPVWPGSIAVDGADAGRDAVATAIAEGADFVKVYSLLPRKAYFAIAEEARARGIPFDGHVPGSVSASEASAAGQRSMEHLMGVMTACSDEERELRAEAVAAGGWIDQTDRLLATYDEEKCAALFTHFAKNGTWHCPTLTVLRNTAYIPDPSIVDDPNLKYMPPMVRQMWNPERVMRWTTPEAFAKYTEIVGAMQRAGVQILAGTDALNPYCFPGFSLHDELELLVEAGLTPLEALQAATLNPADFFGMRERHGTVEEGRIADLVLLDADPLERIGNTRKIAAVVIAGRLYRRPELESMLREIEKLANPETDDAAVKGAREGAGQAGEEAGQGGTQGAEEPGARGESRSKTGTDLFSAPARQREK